MDGASPVVVTELDVPAEAQAYRFMAIYYRSHVIAGFGSTYIQAIRDLLNELGTVSRRAR